MNKYVIIGLRIVVAIVLIQTLRFKLTAHPDSVYIFTKVGMEPIGRIVIGIIELIAGVLILIPRTIWLGSLLALGVVSGAIFMHLTKLGIEVNGDSGILFYTAILIFSLSGILLWVCRKNIPFLKNLIKK